MWHADDKKNIASESADHCLSRRSIARSMIERHCYAVMKTKSAFKPKCKAIASRRLLEAVDDIVEFNEGALYEDEVADTSVSLDNVVGSMKVKDRNEDEEKSSPLNVSAPVFVPAAPSSFASVPSVWELDEADKKEREDAIFL